MRDYLTIGSTPAAEQCASLGSENYSPQASAEIRAFRNQIIRVLGEPPFGARLKRKGFDHDFGMYYELIAEYDVDDEEAAEYAFKCESESPEYWDEEALKELEEAGFPVKKS